MQNLMTQNLIALKIFIHILTTCLLFGSLYLPAYATDANKATNPDNQLKIKKAPEAYFLEGNMCLEQSNPACANIALANIPSLSPYAKLLQGAIALNDQRTDDALQLLLPLQADKNLSAEAKISLHLKLATVFENAEDVPQAAGHLMQAKAAVATLPDSQIKIEAIHQKIWSLLNKQEQSILIAMRGNNTDDEFQGWIDLCLASKNQDVQASIASWAVNYPDHSATAFAKVITSNSKTPQHQEKLASDGIIALIVPLADEANAARAEALKQGLQASLNIHAMPNEIKIYASKGSTESITEQYLLAKSEGATYFVAPNFSIIKDEAAATSQDTKNILHIGLFIDDEARRIASFAARHAIQRILIIETNTEAAQQISNTFKDVWRNEVNVAEPNDQIHVITLASDLQSGDASLIDLKAQISAHRHDMVLLAMPAPVARIIKPYLNISTPTIAFSNLHDDTRVDASLNAVRFVDIPFLLPTNNEKFKPYQEINIQDSNELSRWFALGADTPDLLIAYQNNDRETTINGLTGMLTLNKAGSIQRQPTIARFTFDSIALEQ